MRIERSFRGISERLARRYLTNLGGKPANGEESTVKGEGWQATLSAEKVAIGQSLTLNEVTVVFEGEQETLKPLIDSFAQKAMRAGG